ncbi:MAG: phosphatase PAP2 family protein [Proteobacteria bacterium]|nr:phosphatase PAP2 family protein [Pseudomonadota bacterium]
MKTTNFNIQLNKQNKLIFISSFLLIFLSLIALFINSFFIKFSGNNYFPPGFWGIGLILTLILSGLFLIFEKNSYYYQTGQEFFYFFIVYSIIALATNAVQFTPFRPVDLSLIKIDSYLGIHLASLMSKTANYPRFKTILEFSYLSLAYQMAYLPILFIVLQKIAHLREYYCLLFLTAILGFSLYYFFPTMGPASFIKSNLFTEEQFATGLKFTEIHSFHIPSTSEGGLIALPSFHAIWAFLCILLTRSIPILFYISLILNSLLISSCVLLGWHYFIDIVAAAIILSLAYFIYFRYTSALSKCYVLKKTFKMRPG